MFVRLALRRSSWEEPRLDSQQLIETEFRASGGGIDLKPSVYELDSAGQFLRASAEHCASIPLDPPHSGKSAVEFSNAPSLVTTPGTSRFGFTKQRHRELRFGSEEELQRFVMTFMFGNTVYDASKKELVEFATSRINQKDTEWLQFCAEVKAKKATQWGCPSQRI